MSERPVVRVRPVVLTTPPNRGTRLLVFDCPWCGGKHTHGGGRDGKPIDDFLGLRTSHCLKHADSYRLELDPPAA